MIDRSSNEDAGLFDLLAADGRPLLLLTAVALLVSGAFALFLSVRREFLPHDVAFLGMTAGELCAHADCRVVRFMFHDRVAFGPAVAGGVLFTASFLCEATGSRPARFVLKPQRQP